MCLSICYIPDWFFSPGISQACRRRHHRPQAAQCLPRDDCTGRVCETYLHWRPGLKGEIYIDYNPSRDFSRDDGAVFYISLPCGWTGSVLEVEGVWSGLEVLRRKPGKWFRLTRWSSRRRAWELASSSRKWPGSCNGVSHSKIARNRGSYYLRVICNKWRMTRSCAFSILLNTGKEHKRDWEGWHF